MSDDTFDFLTLNHIPISKFIMIRFFMTRIPNDVLFIFLAILLNINKRRLLKRRKNNPAIQTIMINIVFYKFEFSGLNIFIIYSRQISSPVYFCYKYVLKTRPTKRINQFIAYTL